eukprot:1937223-Prymnesium_polylepis.1
MSVSHESMPIHDGGPLFAGLYALLLALRVALVAAPGYVHPDEFFQSAEPAAWLLGRAAAPPW